MKRVFRHSFIMQYFLKRQVSKSLLNKIEKAVAESESLHRGQLQIVIETAPPRSFFEKIPNPHDRAVDLFSVLRTWDTQENTGILLYIQLADKYVEVVADRGINAAVDQSKWEEICSAVVEGFRQGDIEKGILSAIESATVLLRENFPGIGENDLSNAPVFLY